MLSELNSQNDTIQDSGVFYVKKILKTRKINERLAKLALVVEQQGNEYLLDICSNPNYLPIERVHAGQRYKLCGNGHASSRIQFKQYTKADGTSGSAIEAMYCDLFDEGAAAKPCLLSVEQVKERVSACAELLKYKATAADYCLALALSGVELPKPG